MYENLKAEIVRKKLTLSIVSKQSGMTKQRMSSRINGKTPFTFDEAMTIKQVLGVDIPLEVLFKKEVV